MNTGVTHKWSRDRKDRDGDTFCVRHMSMITHGKCNCLSVNALMKRISSLLKGCKKFLIPTRMNPSGIIGEALALPNYKEHLKAEKNKGVLLGTSAVPPPKTGTSKPEKRTKKGQQLPVKMNAPIGTIASVGKIKLCLNLASFSPKTGGLVNVGKCNRPASQQWKLTKTGLIQLAADTKWCLNLNKYSKQNGGVLNLWKCNGKASQKWAVTGKQIKLAADKQWCLNLHGNEQTSGGQVNLWKCTGTSSQNWMIPTVTLGETKAKAKAKKIKIPKDARIKGIKKKHGAESKGCRGVCPDVRGLVKELKYVEMLCTGANTHSGLAGKLNGPE